MPTADGGKSGRGKAISRGVWWAVIAALFLFALSVSIPLHEGLMSGSIDAGWNLTLFWAHRHTADFGHDIIFNFGPWGFIYQGYTRDTAGWHLAGWLLIAVATFAGVWHIARQIPAPRWMAALWILAVFTIAASTDEIGQDIHLFFPSWLLFLIYFCGEAETSPRTVNSLLLAAMGLASLVKFSSMLMCVPILLAISADELIRGRIPRVAGGYIVSLVVWWLAAHQRLGSLVPWLRNSWELTSGYGPAMELEYYKGKIIDSGLFLLTAAFFFAILATGFWRREGKETSLGRRRFLRFISIMGGIAAVIFILFKAGFVRHDGHAVMAVNSLDLFWLLAAGVLWKSRALNRILVACAVLAGLGLASHAGYQWSQAGPLDQFQSAASALPGWPLRCFAWAREDQSLIAADPAGSTGLPSIQGSLDLYPGATGIIFSPGVRYTPRPVIQSYLAYTPRLARINADFLNSSRAPDTILFNVKSIDDRYPSQDDAMSWPLLLTRYEIQSGDAKGLVLARSAVPGHYEFTQLQKSEVPFGETIQVPTSDEPIWLRIGVQETGWGKIAAMLDRPPMLGIRVTTVLGKTRDFSIVPAVAADGFLLSPAVLTTRTFARFASSQWRELTQNLKIRQISVIGFWGSDPEGFYQPNCEVTFSTLKFDHHDLSQAPGMSQYFRPLPGSPQ